MSTQKSTLSAAPTQSPTPSPPTANSHPPASPAALGGHQPATSLAVEGILERVRRGKGAASLEERVLANVCELRRAVASGEWLAQLTPDCHDALAAARFALNEVGAMSIAVYFSETMATLEFTRSPQRLEALLLKLKRDLNAAGPVLDALIARYAQRLLDAGIPSAPDGSETPNE
jgi:hypothetical protein